MWNFFLDTLQSNVPKNIVTIAFFKLLKFQIRNNLSLVRSLTTLADLKQ